MESDQILALLGQVENSHGPKVIDLQSFSDRVVEIDAGSTVENHVDLFCENLSDLWLDTQALEDQVARDGDHAFLYNLKHLWSFLEKGDENFSPKYFFHHALLQGKLWLVADEQVDLANARNFAKVLLEEHLADEARDASHEHCFVREKLAHVKLLCFHRVAGKPISLFDQ